MANNVGVKILLALRDTDNSASKALKDVGTTNDRLSKAFKMANVTAYLGALKMITSRLKSCVEASANYVENLNLLDVAFGKSSQSAQDFIDKLSGAFGLDESTLTRQLGLFRQIGNSLNIDSEYADKLAKNLTKMQLDMSSLYNIDFDRAGSILQSALAGQTKGIRSATGADITEATLQTDLLRLGINKQVDELNRASKVVLIYNSLARQLATSQGDLAKTINSPANQMRIFREQCSRLARAIGNVLLPAVGAILPYFNAFLMVLVKIINTLAHFVGFDAKKFAGIGTGVSGVTTDFEDASDAADGLSKSAKEAQKSLRGFDKLNVINTPKNTSGSGSGGVGGGVDPALLAALTDYDMHLDSIKNKATELVEQFEKWLKVLEPLKEPLEKIAALTFDGLAYLWENVLKPLGIWIGWTLIPQMAETLGSALEFVYQVLLRMKPILKFIMEQFLIPFGRTIGKTIINMLQDIKKLFDWLSKSKVATTIAAVAASFVLLSTVGSKLFALFSATKLGGTINAFASTLMLATKETGSFKKGLQETINIALPGTKKVTDSMSKMEVATTKVNNVMSKLKVAALGAVAAFAGFSMVSASIQDIRENGLKLGNAFGLLVGTLTTVIGVVVTLTTVVSLFNAALATNPIFLAITAFAGLALAIGAIVKGFKDSKKAADENTEAMKKAEKQARQNAESGLLEISRTQELYKELTKLADANGKVNEGDEKRAREILPLLNEVLGTNYELVNNQITQDGEAISLNGDLANSIDRIIAKKKAEIVINSYADVYTQALKNQKAAAKELDDAQQQYNDTLKRLKTQYDNGHISASQYEKWRKEAQKDLRKSLEESSIKYDKAQKKVIQYEDLIAKQANGTTKEINKSIDEFTGTSEKKFATMKKNVEKTLGGLKNTNYCVNVRADTSGINSGLSSYFRNNTWQAKINGQAGAIQFTQITRRAKGGFPDEGEMFIAREAGPELVGTLGNHKNAVANNDQITEGIRRAARDGFLDAMQLTQGSQKVNVNITAEGDTSGLLNFINFKEKQKDRQYGL